MKNAALFTQEEKPPVRRDRFIVAINLRAPLSMNKISQAAQRQEALSKLAAGLTLVVSAPPVLTKPSPKMRS